MRKSANKERSAALPTEQRDDASQHIKRETTADPDVAGEIGTVKLEAYLAHLAHLDVPLSVKIELIHALQLIMQSFVDRAFGDDPAQLACEANVRSGLDVL